jgi:hypothetical protein
MPVRPDAAAKELTLTNIRHLRAAALASLCMFPCSCAHGQEGGEAHGRAEDSAAQAPATAGASTDTIEHERDSNETWT